MKDEQSRYEGRRRFKGCLHNAGFYAERNGFLPDRMGQDPCSVYRYSAKHAAAFFAGQ